MRHQESTLQQACVRWFALAHPDLYADRRFYAVPNGGWRNAITAKVMKAEGVLAGVADLHLDIPSGGYHGLRIEMKNGKQGRQSEAQKAYEQGCIKYNYQYAICRSVEEFVNIVNNYIYIK